MSDITTFANRVLPIDVELYDEPVEEFPDRHTVGMFDVEYKLQLTLKNKNAASPYTVAATDLTNVDKVRFNFYPPDSSALISKTATVSDAANGIAFVSIDHHVLHTPGVWNVEAQCIEGDIYITYPRVLIYVQ